MTDLPLPVDDESRRRALELVEAELAKRRQSAQVLEERDSLTQRFDRFVKEAWPHLEPHQRLMSNWHIDAICEHLQAISENQLRRLQIWVPPGSMKSRLVSVLWPAWEWTHTPSLRYWTASYDISLSKEMAMYSRDLMLTGWYQDRWGEDFAFRKTDESFFINDKGGHRLSTSPSAGQSTGKHGHRLMFDDPLNAKDANMISKAVLDSTNEWYRTVTATRGVDSNYAEVIIMQRLHENDMAFHALQFGTWEVLCLPEEYVKTHPYAWSKDPRKEGELLWPAKRPRDEHTTLVQKLGKRHASAQLQQMPAAREGTIIPRGDWRYYPVAAQEAADNGDTTKLPPFRSIVISWDTAVKDLNHSDYVAGGVWGIHGGNRYLLRTFHQRASMSATKRAMKDLRQWALDRWPHVPHRTLIEKASNGVEIVKQLKKEIPGVIDVTVSGDKQTRAEAAEPDFNSHNILVPGEPTADYSDYDPARTPSWVQDVIEECSAFPVGKNDDLVDMVTLALNWTRTRSRSPVRTASALATAARNRRRPTLHYQQPR